MSVAIIDYGLGISRVFVLLWNVWEFLANYLVNQKPFSRLSCNFPRSWGSELSDGETQKYPVDKPIPELTQPVLGICLGMQLM